MTIIYNINKLNSLTNTIVEGEDLEQLKTEAEDYLSQQMYDNGEYGYMSDYFTLVTYDDATGEEVQSVIELSYGASNTASDFEQHNTIGR